MPGRDITDNIVKTLNMISTCATVKTEVALLSVDIKKVFDTLETSHCEPFWNT